MHAVIDGKKNHGMALGGPN